MPAMIRVGHEFRVRGDCETGVNCTVRQTSKGEEESGSEIGDRKGKTGRNFGEGLNSDALYWRL